MENQQDEIAVGADVDVKALMAEVRAEVERKKREGLYPPEVLEELDTIGAKPGADQLTRALLGLRHGVAFDTAVPISSQIPIVSPLAASFKFAVRSSIRWYVSALVQQFEQFGANVLHVLNLISDRVRKVEEGAERQAAEQEVLADSVRALELEVGRLMKRLEERRDADPSPRGDDQRAPDDC